MAKEKVNTPAHISSLLQPLPGQSADRRGWSIPIKGVWVPFFLATNTAGETSISAESLGAPLRLMREGDGTPKFGRNGRPVIRVVKELSDQIRIVRENFAQGLLNYAHTVRQGMPQEFQAQVHAAERAGEVIATRDANDLEVYLKATMPEVKADEVSQPASEPVTVS